MRRLERLADAEREGLPEFLACLAEGERRGAHLDAGFPSLFEYCVGRLRLSEGAAAQRVYAARAAARYPEIYASLRDGELTVSGVARLAPHLDAANAAAILGRARGRRQREIEALIVELVASKERVSSVERDDGDAQSELSFETRRDDGQEKETDGPAEAPGTGGDHGSPREGARSVGPGAASSRARDVIRLEAPGVVRVSFQADAALRGKLELARAFLGRRHDGRLESVLSLVLDDYIARHDPARWGAGVRARGAGKARAASRRVPREVKAVVWRRHGGRCAFVAPDGARCAARERLEYDHARPWALGGTSDDAANIRLLCRAHNLRAARRIFGTRVPGAR